ncbi:glycoside hydrolase family 2 protein [Brachybacterium sp. J144]|uniref:glycoside hydrolase family 2 protein n=1 Tax=Brachybacterium sp. J144 TaxID=3116487 RepID=UPI002E76B672|nr:glycoside hydrolase family 2 protein [Brachybacterium sp. J144]MEE1650193.1 glycoside hydrolase family 2 protein [Brachybacterium sp. J144]
MTVSRRDLHEGWTLTVTDGPIPFAVQDLPATVPGTFLTDLLDAGLIEDPYLDRNEHEVAWSGECDLVYRTVFTLDTVPTGRTDLVAASLDTAATVVLNGTEVATVQNQHRSWRWAVERLLREGENALEIRFASPLRTARENAQAQGNLPFVGNALPYNAIRKMACNLGWDWGPVLVTSGIAGPIGLESWSGARLDRVRPLVVPAADGPSGTVTVQVPVEREPGTDAPLHARLEVAGADGTVLGAATAEIPAGTDAAELSVALDAVERWWPRGYGEQPLYTARVLLEDAAAGGDPSADDDPATDPSAATDPSVGEPLDQVTHRIAFRTAGVVEELDAVGTSFTLAVNDRPILVKGANWIPDDCFPTRLTPADYARGVGHAVDAGMNLLRIWGGGLYESEELYDLCDELGVMVWQDVALACAAYSEEQPLRGEIEAELREHAVRLAWHPALVHWNGSNENVEGYYHWGWKDVLPEGKGWGNAYYTEILPAILAELDPTRSFTPSSPYSRGALDQPRNPDHGTVHNWVVWASEEDNDYVHYRDTDPRFAAEFGFQGPASWATIERAISERPLTADSPAMLSHQKAVRGQEKLISGYRPHFPDPDPGSFADFHLTTSLNQARALRVGIGHYRSLWPHCTGTIIWQLNDCWPVTSWAAVDGDGRRKLLWYAMRDLYAPRLLTVQPREDGPVAALGNDTDEELTGTLRLRRIDAEGTVLAEESLPVQVPERCGVLLPLPAAVATAADPAREALLLEMQGHAGEPVRAVHWYAEDKDLALDPDALEVSAAADPAEPGAVVLTLRARSLVRDAVVVADRVHPSAVADRQMLDLLPGESAVVQVTAGADGPLEPEAFLADGVVRSVNELVARAAR